MPGNVRQAHERRPTGIVLYLAARRRRGVQVMSRRSKIRKRERLKRKYTVRPETGRAQGSNLAIPQTSADASEEKQAMNLSKAICRPGSFWFSPGFDESAKSFINAHPWPDASNHCYFESVRWADLLSKNGINAEL